MPHSPQTLIRSWVWLAAAALFTVILLATLGIAPTLWYQVLPYFENHLKSIAVIGGSLIAVLLFTKAWGAGPRHKGQSLLLVVFGVGTVAMLLLTFFADATPAGKLHVIEYAALAYIVLNALNVDRLTDRAVWFALLVLLTIGVIDECIQYLLPNRYFDLMDIAGNWIASGLGLVFWAACSQHSPWRKNPAGK